MKTKNPNLAKIVEKLQQLLREQRKWLLLIGTGPSMAISSSMGMGALRQHLLTDDNLNSYSGWSDIAKRLRANSDLEQALTDVELNQELRKAITESAGRFVAEKDADCRNDILTGLKDWPCTSLLKKLVQRLPKNSPRLPIVTSNYDLFIEYACSYAGIPYTTGYIGGILKRLDWNSARAALFLLSSISERGKRRNIIVPVPSAEIMKVHGSINLYKSPNGDVIEGDVWSSSPPAGYSRVLASPGDLKNYAVTENREKWFAEADRAIGVATAFFAIGYGFNDAHIHKMLVEKAKGGAPIIVLTRDSSATLDDLSKIGENIWILTGAKDSTGRTRERVTRVKNRTLSDEVEIENERLWLSDVFVSKVMGE